MLASALAVPALADIGFAQAAATARLLNPGRPLLGLRHKLNANPVIYTTANVNARGTMLYGLELHGSLGTVLASDVEAVLPPEDAEIAAVLDRLDHASISFEQAIARAQQATGRPESLLERIDLASELFMLFYDMRYSDGTRLMVDAVNGSVVPAADNASAANALPPYAMFTMVGRAEAMAGDPWLPFEVGTAVTPGGLAVGVALLQPSSGRVLQIDMLGKQTESLEFTPVGHLAGVVAGIRGTIDATAVDLGGFLARIEHDFPGGRVSGVVLQSRLANNGTMRTEWSAMILTALGQSVEFTIDAMQPVDTSLGISTVPVQVIGGDLNRDGHVTGEDLAEMLQMYNAVYPPYDLDHDGMVKGEDLAILLSNWG